MGDEQRVSWQQLLAQSRDDFEAATYFTFAVTFRFVGRRVPAYQHTPERRKASTENENLGFSTGAVCSTAARCSHHAVILVYDEAGNVIETHEHAGEFNEP